MEKLSFYDKFIKNYDRDLINREEVRKVIRNLASSVNLQATVLDSLNEGLLLCDEDDVIIYYNKKASLFFEGIKKESLQSFIPAELYEQYSKVKQGIKVNTYISSINLFKTSYLLEYEFIPLMNDFSKNILIVMYDVHAKYVEQREQNINKAFKNLMELSYSLAHEIRNPLTALDLNLKLTRRLIDEKSELSPRCLACKNDVNDQLEAISSEIKRLNTILDDFLYSAKPLNPRFIPMNINEIIKDIAYSIGAQFQMMDKKLTLKLKEDIDPVYSDPDLLKQVLLNLLKNALDAINDVAKGEVILSTFDDDINIYITVKDNGKGIDKENLSKIFNPFYTTKASGTGLGLTIVYKIIATLSSDIKVESKLGNGTLFKIIFDKSKAKMSLLHS